MNVVKLFDDLTKTTKYDLLETMNLTGWLTDGVMLFRPPAKLVAALLARKANMPPNLMAGQPLPVGMISDALAVKGKLSPCRVEGEPGDYYGVLRYTLRGDRHLVVVDAVRYETLRKHHPQATAFVSSRKKEPVAFCEDGKIVAVLMPWI
jgi:hypothetical protein